MALPALACALVVLTHQWPAGSLDDVFVVLAEARGWVDGPGTSVSASPITLSGSGGGSTSLLDLWVKALCLHLSPDADPLRVAGWIGIALCLAAGWIASVAALRWTGSGLAAGIGALGVLLAPGLLESAGYLLEGPLFGVLWLLALVAMVSGGWMSVAATLLALSLARPEGALLAPLVGLCAQRGSTQGHSFVALKGALLGLAAAGAAVLFRFASFGYWLPTTYYAKASDSRWLEVIDGLHYVWRVLSTGPGLVVIAVAACAWIFSMAAEPERRIRARKLLLLGLAYALAVIASGGDSYQGARLFMPVGLAVWLAAVAAWPRRRSISSAFAGVAAVTVLTVSFAQLPGAPPPAVRSTLDALRAGPIGLEAFEGDPEVFAAVAAVLGGGEIFAHRHTQRFRWFEPGIPVLDLTGLTDRNVARRPAPGPILFGRDAIDLALEERVGAMHLDPLSFRPRSMVDVDLVAALSDPELAAQFGGEPYLSPSAAEEIAKDYVAASRTARGAGGVFNLLVRKDLGDKFRQAGFRVAR